MDLTTLSIRHLEQALANNGYLGMHMKLQACRFSHFILGHQAVYCVDWKQDGSFNNDGERLNQRLYVEIHPVTLKVNADF